MKKMIVATVYILIIFTGAVLCQAGGVEMGKRLFESPVLMEGTSGKSCNTCHEGGKNLSSDLFSNDKKFLIMGMEKNSLAEVINVCIEKAIVGTAFKPNGERMAQIIEYMKTLVK